jgi:hypothetical protein
MTINSMQDESGHEIDNAPHAVMTVYMPVDKPVVKGAMLRREKK